MAKAPETANSQIGGDLNRSQYVAASASTGIE